MAVAWPTPSPRTSDTMIPGDADGAMGDYIRDILPAGDPQRGRVP